MGLGCESTPIVLRGRLYRFEYMNESYRGNILGGSYFRFIDVSTEESTEPFAEGYHLGSAFVSNDRVWVYGVNHWGENAVHAFWSDDLESWNDQEALSVPGWSIYNNSVCKDDRGHTMAIEFGGPPEVVGKRFTIFFARSKDLLKWELYPTECVYSKEKYTACPALRFYSGYYYMIYLEHYEPRWYFAPHIIRSEDLIHWEDSPFNPLFEPSPEDRHVASPRLSKEDRALALEAENCNNSDLDLCEFQGKTIINYCWSNQRGGPGFLCEAIFEGTEEHFLNAYFPEQR